MRRRVRRVSPGRSSAALYVAGVVLRVPRARAVRRALHEPHGAPGEHSRLAREAVDPHLRERRSLLSPSLPLLGLVVRHQRRLEDVAQGPPRTETHRIAPRRNIEHGSALAGRACEHGPAEHDHVRRRLDGVVGRHLDGPATVQPALRGRLVAQGDGEASVTGTQDFDADPERLAQRVQPLAERLATGDCVRYAPHRASHLGVDPDRWHAEQHGLAAQGPRCVGGATHRPTDKRVKPALAPTEVDPAIPERGERVGDQQSARRVALARIGCLGRRCGDDTRPCSRPRTFLHPERRPTRGPGCKACADYRIETPRGRCRPGASDRAPRSIRLRDVRAA